MGGMVPLQLELDHLSDGRMVGWAVTTGLRGQIVTRVEGCGDETTFDLEEMTERADRGRYAAKVVDGELMGEFVPVDPAGRTMAFTLRRRPG